MNNIKINFNSYIFFGLNRNRHFLQAPECECGCGQPAYLILKDHDAVGEFCSTVLFSYDCPDSAIFAIFNDGHYEAFVKEYDEDREQYVVSNIRCDDKDSFAELDGMYRLCCYNIIIEEQPGQWMIQ